MFQITIPSNAPDEVRKVAEHQNDCRTDKSMDVEFHISKPFSCYPDHVPENEWIIGPDIEGFGPSFVFNADKSTWYARCSWNGSDHLVEGGIEQVKVELDHAINP